MKNFIALFICLMLSGCVGDNHQRNHNTGDNQPSANGTVAIAVGKQDVTPQVGLQNTTTHTEAGAGSTINDPTLIESAYRSMVIIVLTFAAVLVVGFSGLVIVLVRGHQRHVKDLLDRRIP